MNIFPTNHVEQLGGLIGSLQIDSPMHRGAGRAYDEATSQPDTSAAERHLMVTALQACERGEPEAVMLSTVNLSGRSVTIRAKDLVETMLEADVFAVLVLAAKSADTEVRLAAQALLAGACDEFARGWSE